MTFHRPGTGRGAPGDAQRGGTGTGVASKLGLAGAASPGLSAPPAFTVRRGVDPDSKVFAVADVSLLQPRDVLTVSLYLPVPPAGTN
jgi:hypothetical protein